MSTYEIAVVVGSLRRDSYNRKLAQALMALGPPELRFKQLRIDDLPPYNQDDDAHPSDPARRLKAEVQASHGLLFVTPEYNRSIPGVLKNAIDHASRPYGDNAWAGKPAGIVGISIAAAGSAMAQQHLHNVLVYLDVPTLAQPEVFIQAKEGLFDERGGIANPETRTFLSHWMQRYVGWVKQHATQTIEAAAAR